MGHSEVVKELILAGADPNITDCNRVTPLFISIASSNLFDAGALELTNQLTDEGTN